MHDAHLGCALFFLDMLAEYTCLWYVVGMNLVCPMTKFPHAPFARAPFGESRQTIMHTTSHHAELPHEYATGHNCKFVLWYKISYENP